MDVMSVHFRNKLVVLSNLIMGTGIMGVTPKKTASHFITVTKIVSVNEIKLRNQHCVECCDTSYNSCKRDHGSFLSCFTMFDSRLYLKLSLCHAVNIALAATVTKICV